MKTVILPTDFSENARHAHDYAVSVLGTQDVKYILLNAFELKYKPSSMMLSLEEEMKKESLQDLKKELENLKSNHSGIDADTVASSGSLVSTLERMIKEGKGDMVAMGTRGASGIASIIGSNTYDVVKNAPCPIMIVPEQAEVKSPEKILLASDFKSLEDDDVILPMIEIAKNHNAEIAILNVVKDKEMVDTEEAAQGVKLHRQLADVNHSFYFTENDNVEEGINSFAEKKKIDIITMIAREESLWHRIFHPSETRKMTLHSKNPVLVLHE